MLCEDQELQFSVAKERLLLKKAKYRLQRMEYETRLSVLKNQEKEKLEAISKRKFEEHASFLVCIVIFVFCIFHYFNNKP